MAQRDPDEGARFSIGGGETFTVNSTDDPSAPGGHYETTSKDGSSEHSTAVYDADGSMPSGMGNNDDYQ